jgi:hypothetical protein
MSAADSSLDADEVSRAKALLQPAVRKERIWPVLAAAFFAAICALAFAAAMITAPPVVSEHVAATKTIR